MAKSNPVPPIENTEPTPELGMDDAALGTNATGLYFTKAPKIDAWHAFTQEHEPVGMIVPEGTAWGVKIGRVKVPTTFSSATAARAYLMGWHDRDVQAASAPAPAQAGEKPEGGFHADASTVVRS